MSATASPNRMVYAPPPVLTEETIKVEPIKPPFNSEAIDQDAAKKRPAAADGDQPRPKSPPFNISREPVEQLLEKPRYSAGWYRKADRNRQEAADAPAPMPHTEAALAAAAQGTPSRDPGSPAPDALTPKDNSKETWSVVYQVCSTPVGSAPVVEAADCCRLRRRRRIC